MKKLTQLITESVINYNLIEDAMMHLEDMGFKIRIFNDMGGLTGEKRMFFGSGDLSSMYGQMNTYSSTPIENGDSYPLYMISLRKEILPFTDCDLYVKVISEAESIKKRLSECEVHYKLLNSTIDGQNSGGMLGNTPTHLNIIFHILDRSRKISRKSIAERGEIESMFITICRNYGTSNIQYVRWGYNDITLVIQTNKVEHTDKILNTIKSIKYGIPKNFNYKIDIQEKESTFLGNTQHGYYITASPK